MKLDTDQLTDKTILICIIIEKKVFLVIRGNFRGIRNVFTIFGDRSLADLFADGTKVRHNISLKNGK